MKRITILSLLKAIHDLLKHYLEERQQPSCSEIVNGNFYNRKEAASYLLVHPKTVTNWRKRNILPATTQDGKIPLYHEKDLDRCFEWHWGRPKRS